jgi:hypothetical protein
MGGCTPRIRQPRSSAPRSDSRSGRKTASSAVAGALSNLAERHRPLAAPAARICAQRAGVSHTGPRAAGCLI